MSTLAASDRALSWLGASYARRLRTQITPELSAGACVPAQHRVRQRYVRPFGGVRSVRRPRPQCEAPQGCASTGRLQPAKSSGFGPSRPPCARTSPFRTSPVPSMWERIKDQKGGLTITIFRSIARISPTPALIRKGRRFFQEQRD
jgi:hypothetical protein